MLAYLPARPGSLYSRKVIDNAALFPQCAVGSAAYVMSEHGAEGDEQSLESRLERWRKQWGGHAAELDAQGGVTQRMAEVNLVSSLVHSKVWKLTKEKALKITRGCVTEDCRRYEPK